VCLVLACDWDSKLIAFFLASRKGSPPVIKIAIKNVGKRQVTLVSGTSLSSFSCHHMADTWLQSTGHEAWDLFTSEDFAEDLKHRSASSTASTFARSSPSSLRPYADLCSDDSPTPCRISEERSDAQSRDHVPRFVAVSFSWANLTDLLTHRNARCARYQGSHCARRAQELYRGRPDEGQAMKEKKQFNSFVSPLSSPLVRSSYSGSLRFSSPIRCGCFSGHRSRNQTVQRQLLLISPFPPSPRAYDH
jgi:hypothetical protein